MPTGHETIASDRAQELQSLARLFQVLVLSPLVMSFEMLNSV
jgi:hypothetical protein